MLRIVRERLLDRRLHADDRHIVEASHLIHGNGGRCIAGNDHGIGALLLDEKTKCGADKAAHGRNRFSPVRHMIAVGVEEKLLRRQHPACMTEHRQTAIARIKQRNAHLSISSS